MTESRGERGAVMPMFALCLTVLMAMSAFALDLGVLFTERRQAQSSADTGALGGALDLASGMNTATEATGAIIRANLNQTYSDAEWAMLWASCIDTGALTFTGEVLGTPTNCISFDGLGTYRVVVPEQEIDAVFANVVGHNTFSTSAFAEVELTPPGSVGVLPFAVLGSASSGSAICLRSSTSGTAVPPCTGSASGNFGALDVAQWGNPAYGTETLPCNLNGPDQLLVNISVGLDHFIRPYTGTEVIDDCSKPYGPNTLNTYTGFSGGIFEGMIEGDVISGAAFPGRLTQTSGATQIMRQQGHNYAVDDVPLWEYIPYGKGATVPPTCTRESFDATVMGSGYPAADAQMSTCFVDYQAGFGFAVLFDRDANSDNEHDIASAARFGAVPQFWETTFPSGGSNPLHIKSFRAVYINGLDFGCTGTSCSVSHTPGSASGTLNLPNGSSPLDQVSAYLLPNSTLPPDLLINGVNGALGAFQIRLSR